MQEQEEKTMKITERMSEVQRILGAHVTHDPVEKGALERIIAGVEKDRTNLLSQLELVRKTRRAIYSLLREEVVNISCTSADTQPLDHRGVIGPIHSSCLLSTTDEANSWIVENCKYDYASVKLTIEMTRCYYDRKGQLLREEKSLRFADYYTRDVARQ